MDEDKHVHVHRPSEIEADPLAAAASEVGRSIRPDGSTSETEWRDARERETEALLAWAGKVAI